MALTIRNMARKGICRACGLVNITKTSEWKEAFLDALKVNDIDTFRQLLTQSKGLWRKIRYNNTLLQQAILLNRFEIFKYLLEFCDVQYLETKNSCGHTAITLAMGKSFGRRYVLNVVKKYNTIPSHYERNLLHWAILAEDYYLTETLLMKGMDPNAGDIEKGATPLHRATGGLLASESYALTNILLLYGADPFIKFENFNAFERAVVYQHRPATLELLFEYTFDKLQRYRINFKVLLQLAKNKSPLFNRLLEYDVDFIVEEMKLTFYGHSIDLLFDMTTEYLTIILAKYYSQVCDCLRFWDDESESWNQWLFSNVLLHESFLDRLNIFLESGATARNIIVNFISTINSLRLFEFVLSLEESAAMKTITLLSLCGLQIPKQAFDLVYQVHGYRDLFKFLLHMDYVENQQEKCNLIVSLIRDVHSDLHSVLQTPEIYSKESLLNVLHYFAHKKLQLFLLKKINDEDLQFSEKDLQKVRDHPEVPCLVELARNGFRKHLIERFQIKSTKQFYCIVEKLDVNSTYKKIITFETKLY